MSVIKLRNTFKNSTTIFLGVRYTLIDHSNNVNMFKTHCGTTNRRRVMSLQRFEHFDVTPLVDKCVDHRKSLSICFLTLTFSYAYCHYVPLRFLFFGIARAQEKQIASTSRHFLGLYLFNIHLSSQTIRASNRSDILKCALFQVSLAQ